MTTTRTYNASVRVRSLGCDSEHVVAARILGHETFAGREMVRWEPTETLTGCLAYCNGHRSLVLPIGRVVA